MACGTSVVLSAEEESWCRFWGSEDGESLIYGNVAFGDYTDFNYWKKTFFSSAETVGANPENYKTFYNYGSGEKINLDWFIRNIDNQDSKSPEICKTWYGLVQGKSFVD